MEKPPDTIYLQWFDEDGEAFDPARDEVTWCADRINTTDVAYVRESRLAVLEAQLTTAHGIEVADFRQVETLGEELSNMEAERGALKDILREVWNQFSIPASDGRRWSGGLSVLDDALQAIGDKQ